MKIWAVLFLLAPLLKSYAGELPIRFDSSVKEQDRKTLTRVFKDASARLPQKFLEGLPKDITIRVQKITDHNVIPANICLEKAETEEEEKKGFVYGHYLQDQNVLTLHSAVITELEKGKELSKKIKCQHKSLYDQAMATIIHELTHAYDMNNGHISHSMEYIRRAGFKKGLLKVKNKNIEAMRPADPYELTSITESFAVNMEYFAMDPEFMCRKPSLFDFYQRHFGEDPFPERACRPNNIVMMSSMQGYIPVELNPSRVFRIDYLLASAGKGIQSGFGHSMFRIVMCAPERQDPISGKTIPATPYGKKCLDDKLYHLVVSYRANVEDATLNYLKGLTGGYPSMLFILNFSDVLEEYNRDELRDVIAYPLTLSNREKDEFVFKVIEEHWNYRGSYKFINNNCAVESYDLLRGALNRPQLDQNKSLTPNGVLEDLDRLQFTSLTHQQKELYKAKTEQLILAYRTAYGVKLSGSEKSQKDAVLKFMEKSQTSTRMKRFLDFQKSKVESFSLNEEIIKLKERMIAASSFSVMEQQILRTLALSFRKKAADKFMNTTDENIKKMIEETGAAFAQPFPTLFKTGYGIPFADEMTSREALERKRENGTEALKKADSFLREIMPVEYATLEEIAESIKIYNNYSLQVRKEFRSKLDNYIVQVLKNMAMEDNSRSLLVSAAEGNNDSLKLVRKHLGEDLVTEREILDIKLRKILSEIING